MHGKIVAACEVVPAPPAFLAKSVESIENKRVEFLRSAKKCKRVCKNLKRKGIYFGLSGRANGSFGGEVSLKRVQTFFEPGRALGLCGSAGSELERVQ